MNVETANRLVQLRKERGFSQEELAEKLGISRQAVSKWERAEASPDTDNLITLARLYGISLDKLLEHEVAATERVENVPDVVRMEEGQPVREEGETARNEVPIGTDGIRIRNGEKRVEVGWKGVRVEKDGGHRVSIDGESVRINGKVYTASELRALHRRRLWREFPITLLTTIAYLAMGFSRNVWHPGWIVFFLIPIVSTAVEAIQHRDWHRFAYPVLVTAVYLVCGFLYGLWHPGWIVFLTIPFYYVLLPKSRETLLEELEQELEGLEQEREDESEDTF